MKAIILAAGIGSRLWPVTEDKPKTLVEVNGRPMLGWILDSLEANQIDQAVVCTGFKSDQVVNYCEANYPRINFTFVENKDYRTTNNMYSLFLAKEQFDDHIILMNADLVFDSDIIRALKEAPETSVAVDQGRYLEESMKVIVRDNKIVHISKKIEEAESYGCSIDIYKILKEDLNLIKSEMSKIIEKNGDRNQWTEVMLDNLFLSGALKAIPLNIGNNRWFEIDNHNDLIEAEKIFSKDLGTS